MIREARILAIDPGCEKSGYCLLSPKGYPLRSGVADNSLVLRAVADVRAWGVLAIESMIVSYSKGAVGKEVFDTARWEGRFIQQAAIRDRGALLVPRADIRRHICGTNSAGDSAVLVNLYNRYGGSRQAAVGTKKDPGPCYGVSSHAWQALALACTVWDTEDTGRWQGA